MISVILVTQLSGNTPVPLTFHPAKCKLETLCFYLKKGTLCYNLSVECPLITLNMFTNLYIIFRSKLQLPLCFILWGPHGFTAGAPEGGGLGLRAVHL